MFEYDVRPLTPACIGAFVMFVHVCGWVGVHRSAHYNSFRAHAFCLYIVNYAGAASRGILQAAAIYAQIVVPALPLTQFRIRVSIACDCHYFLLHIVLNASFEVSDTIACATPLEVLCRAPLLCPHNNRTIWFSGMHMYFCDIKWSVVLGTTRGARNRQGKISECCTGSACVPICARGKARPCVWPETHVLSPSCPPPH